MCPQDGLSTELRHATSFPETPWIGEGAHVFYDVTSNHSEGHTCPLARYGHSRGGKKGCPIMLYGLLTDRDGQPVQDRKAPPPAH